METPPLSSSPDTQDHHLDEQETKKNTHLERDYSNVWKQALPSDTIHLIRSKKTFRYDQIIPSHFNVVVGEGILGESSIALTDECTILDLVLKNWQGGQDDGWEYRLISIRESVCNPILQGLHQADSAKFSAYGLLSEVPDYFSYKDWLRFSKKLDEQTISQNSEALVVLKKSLYITLLGAIHDTTNDLKQRFPTHDLSSIFKFTDTTTEFSDLNYLKLVSLLKQLDTPYYTPIRVVFEKIWRQKLSSLKESYINQAATKLRIPITRQSTLFSTVAKVSKMLEGRVAELQKSGKSTEADALKKNTRHPGFGRNRGISGFVCHDEWVSNLFKNGKIEPSVYMGTTGENNFGGADIDAPAWTAWLRTTKAAIKPDDSTEKILMMPPNISNGYHTDINLPNGEDIHVCMVNRDALASINPDCFSQYNAIVCVMDGNEVFPVTAVPEEERAEEIFKEKRNDYLSVANIKTSIAVNGPEFFLKQ